jgi:hypothetical protein
MSLTAIILLFLFGYVVSTIIESWRRFRVMDRQSDFHSRHNDR